MSVLELKGEIHELITQVQTPTSAQQLLELVRDFLQSQSESADETDDFEEHMTDKQVASVQEAIERSYDSKNLISQPDAKKMLQLWLSQKQ
jgi:hypothetical protein